MEMNLDLKLCRRRSSVRIFAFFVSVSGAFTIQINAPLRGDVVKAPIHRCGITRCAWIIPMEGVGSKDSRVIVTGFCQQHSVRIK